MGIRTSQNTNLKEQMEFIINVGKWSMRFFLPLTDLKKRRLLDKMTIFTFV